MRQMSGSLQGDEFLKRLNDRRRHEAEVGYERISTSISIN